MAIQTAYRGHLFRSRLEARWAVFFENMGVDWVYEHQGFETAHGRYLPDFWLPRLNLYAEVKGQYTEWDVLHMPRLQSLGDATGARVCVLHRIPDPSDTSLDSRAFDLAAPVPDSPCAWCVCPHCGVVGFEYEARVNRASGHADTCPVPGMAKVRTWKHPRISGAFLAARSARFEWGQSGGTLGGVDALPEQLRRHAEAMATAIGWEGSLIDLLEQVVCAAAECAAGEASE